MASDKKQFRSATARWERLHAENSYSVPRDLGWTAILCSYYNSHNDETQSDTKKARRDIKIFRKEALTLADNLARDGRVAEVALNAQTSDVEGVLRDPRVTDIITIGNGTFSSLLFDPDDVFDWMDTSKAADHLKTGQFIQRHCGHFSRELSVPLGMFAMSRHNAVVAPVGKMFEPRGLQHPDNDMLRRVSMLPQLSYEYVKAIFSPIEEPADCAAYRS